MNMIINIPDWCKIGEWIEWNAPVITGEEWVSEKIIAYGMDGFFHQGSGCPVYYTKFDEWGKTIRAKKAGKKNA